jgi:hypothetical protein
MYLFNLTPMAVGLLLLLGSMAVASGITILVVVMLDRHQERVLVEEYTASLEAFLDEMEARLTDDPEGEDFAEWEARSVEEADDRARMIELQRDLRICGDMVDAVADYLDQLHYHPDVVGAEHIPTLVAQLDELIEQEYHLIQITRVPEIIEF